MQIYAFDKQGRLIAAQTALRHQNYTCLECGASVRLRGGRRRQFHFYHYQPTSCQSGSGKSLVHLHIQYALQKMLEPEEIWLEKRFPTIGRIADVVWPAKKIIFEVQVSPIAEEEVQARNHDYKQMGYHVVWLLHDRQFNRLSLTPAENILRSSTHYFTNINAFGKGIFYDQFSIIRSNKRVQRFPRLPLQLKHFLYLHSEQFPRQFPLERKKWEFAFQGDLYHKPFILKYSKKSFPIKKRLFSPFRLVFNYLLEKTCR